MSPEPKNILFIDTADGPHFLGALPAVQAMARSWPESRVSVLTSSPFSALLEHDPLLSRVFHTSSDEDMQLREIRELLTRDSFDLVVATPSRRPLSIDGMPRCGRFFDIPMKDRSSERESSLIARLLLSAGLIKPETLLAPRLHIRPDLRRAAQNLYGTIHGPIVFLAPHSEEPARQLPDEAAVVLGRQLVQRYNAMIVLPCDAQNRSAPVLARSIGAEAHVWRASIEETAAAIEQADLFVASDGELGRLAAALNVPTITLFGPTDSRRRGNSHPHVNIQAAPDCTCRNTTSCGSLSGGCPRGRVVSCMEDLTPTAIVAAADKFLGMRDWYL